MTREEAIKKVAALLRLGNRPGTVGEAGAAAAAAQRLMDKYEIQLAMVDVSEETKPEPEEQQTMFGKKPEGWVDQMKWMEPWRSSLAHGIARANDCWIYTAHRGIGRTIEIVGVPSKVEVVRELYRYLLGEVVHLCDQHGSGMGAVWRREFKEGAASEIGRILMEARAKTKAEALSTARQLSTTALVRVEKALTKWDGGQSAMTFAKSQMRFSSGGRRSVQTNQTARQAGAAAARTIDMGGASRKRIGG